MIQVKNLENFSKKQQKKTSGSINKKNLQTIRKTDGKKLEGLISWQIKLLDQYLGEKTERQINQKQEESKKSKPQSRRLYD